MRQPESYIDFAVYENGSEFIGVASATLPTVGFITQSISGAGIGGNIDAVIAGFLDAMSLTFNFRSVSDAAAGLMSPVKHQLDLRVAEQYWNTTAAQKEVQADKYVVVVIPKTTNLGNVAPASAADVSGEYSVYYFAGFKNGQTLFELDPWNQKCVIGGVDYYAPVKKALGK